MRCPGRVAPPSPSHPPATTAAAAAARATAAAGGGAAGSAGGATAQPHRAALLLLLLLLLLIVLLLLLVEVWLGVLEVLLVLERSLPLPDDPTLREWVIQRGSPGGGVFFCFMWPQRPRDCASQRCVPGRVEAAALGSSESAVAPGAGESAAALGARESTDALGASASTATCLATAEALHTFTLDSSASRCFFRDCTTVKPLVAPVLVSLADPTGGPVVARASTLLPCPAVPSGSLSGLHLPTFSTNLVSNATIQDVWADTFIPRGQRVAICQVAASSQVFASGQLAASCSCRVLSHRTLLWHHHLGHPSLPRLHSMHSHLLVCGLPRSLPSLPRSPAPPCLPCVEGRQRAAPHSFEFPLTTAPLQTHHMDSFTLPASPQQNGIAERRIGLIMEVARTSMIHAATPRFLWPFAVRYAAHQLNLWPCISEPETSPTLRWTGKVGDASVFRVWGALFLVRDVKASKLSFRTLRCVFLGFPTDTPPVKKPKEVRNEKEGVSVEYI
ncbi:unnamed protein product [Closterium sp. NIES-54]